MHEYMIINSFIVITLSGLEGLATPSTSSAWKSVFHSHFSRAFGPLTTRDDTRLSRPAIGLSFCVLQPHPAQIQARLSH